RGGADDDGGAFDAGFGGVENFVFTGEFEAGEAGLGGLQRGGRGFEGDAVGVALASGGLEDGAGVDHVGVAVGAGEGEAGEALADGFFVFGVKVFGFADVDGDGLAGVGHGEGLGLGFAQFGPVPAGVVFAGVVEVGELDPVEGEVALGELFAPAGDEGGEAHGVAAGVGGVGFALIPDDAAQGTGDEGGDHAVVEAAG